MYRARGLAKLFRDYFEKLSEVFVERSLVIVDRSFSNEFARFKVQVGDEEGVVELKPQGSDVVVSFEVGGRGMVKAREGLRRGLWALRSLIYGDVTYAATTIAEGGIEAALSGSAGYLASTIAQIIKETAEELKRREEERAKPEEYREIERMIEEVKTEIITLREEIEIMKEEGKETKTITKRLNRIEKLVEEATKNAKEGKYIEAKAKLQATKKLLNKIEQTIEQT